ncbi:MAG: hypothetical protein ACK4LQ_02085 [Pararhodobacter sp.]
MCNPAFLAALVPGGGAAAAGGAVAGAATAGSGLAAIGTALSVGGSLLQGVMAMQAANEQSRLLDQQAKDEARLAATEESRVRQKFRFQMGQQVIELAGRGIRMDSPVAVFLGETAAREMSFEAQGVRSRGAARTRELSFSGRQSRAQGVQAMLRGGFSAAGSFLTAAPQIWPGMLQ